MTQPIQEPSHDRSMQSANWGVRQLFRRPALPAGTSLGIWGIIGYYTGFTQTAGDKDFPPLWEEAYLSEDAQDGWLEPATPVDEFSMNLTEQGEGALWVVEARAQIFDVGGTPATTDYIGIGNLIQSGSVYNNEDVHHFEQFDVFNRRADDATLNLVATRVFPSDQIVRFVTMETINDCAIDTFVNIAELVIWRPSPGPGTFFEAT